MPFEAKTAASAAISSPGDKLNLKLGPDYSAHLTSCRRKSLDESDFSDKNTQGKKLTVFLCNCTKHRFLL